jgi:hypothetical protein
MTESECKRYNCRTCAKERREAEEVARAEKDVASALEGQAGLVAALRAMNARQADTIQELQRGLSQAQLMMARVALDAIALRRWNRRWKRAAKRYRDTALSLSVSMGLPVPRINSRRP